MKTTGRDNKRCRQIPAASFSFIILINLLVLTVAANANPRDPLPEMPEISWPLFRATFDDPFWAGVRDAEVVIGNYTLVESFSGYALQRAGASVTPFFVPGVDAGQTNLNGSQNTFRFWFNPYWSSTTQTNGAGPGALGVLLALEAIGTKESADGFSLQVNAKGTLLSLVAQSDDQPTLLLETEISWQANHAYLISLACGPQETALFLDGQLSALGAGVPSVPPQLAALFIGSSLAGKSVAWGDFDEVCVFSKPPGARWYHPLTEADLLSYFNYYSPNAAMGPESAEEAAARAERLAAMRARNAARAGTSSRSAFFMGESGMDSLLSASRSSGLLELGCECSCHCATGGPVYFTNVVATLTTNQGMVISFDVSGGSNGVVYGVYSRTNLTSSQPWTWLGNLYTCGSGYLTNQPLDAAFYALGEPPPTMVIAWGDNSSGQSSVPSGLTNAIAVAGSDDAQSIVLRAFSMALRTDGTIVAWGDNSHGQTNVPSGLQGVIAIAAGTDHGLALRFDGTVTNWGSWWASGYPLVTVPSALTNVTAIAAGAYHDLAVRCDGSVTAWGSDTNASYVQVPTNLPPARAVAAGWGHSVALLTNGTVVAWGDDSLETNVPSGLSNVIAIAAGSFHTLALKTDGTVVAWGEGDGSIGFWNKHQSIVPAGLSNVVVIAAGGLNSMALKNDGTVVMWGDNLSLPSYSLNQIAGMGAGWLHGLVIRGSPLTPLIMTQPTNQIVLLGSNATFSVQAASLAGMTYQWQTNTVNIPGATNSSLTLTNVPSAAAGTYRVILSAPGGSTASFNATLVVVTPPVITSFTQPTNPTVLYQTNLTFSVTATAPGQTNGFPLGYQWRFNGTSLSGATSSNYSFSAMLSGSYSVVITNAAGSTSAVWQVTVDYTGSYIHVGTLAYHLSTNAAGHASGFAGNYNDMTEVSGWGHETFVGTNLFWLTNSIWSTNCWLKGVQGLSATSIGFSNRYAGQGLVTMVSPRHCLFANHVHLGQDHFMAAFLDTNNVIYWRTNVETVFIGNDTSVGILNADLPSSVGYLPVVPTNLSSYLPTNNVSVVQGIGMNQDVNIFSQPMTFGDPALVKWSPSSVAPFGLGTNWNVVLRSGDSSAPERLLIGNQLILLSHNTSGGVSGSGPNYTFQINAINKSMHYLSTNNSAGTDYQLTPFSLTNWPVIH